MQARHQNYYRGLGRQVDFFGFLANQLDQLLVNNAHQGLAGGQAVQHFLAQGLLLHLVDEFLDHGQGHVGFQQCEANFAQHFLRVGLGNAGFAFDIFDNAR